MSKNNWRFDIVVAAQKSKAKCEPYKKEKCKLSVIDCIKIPFILIFPIRFAGKWKNRLWLFFVLRNNFINSPKAGTLSVHKLGAHTFL